MNDKAVPRPPQVTFAAGLVMVCSVLVVASVWGRISGLHTLETRQSIEQFLAGPPGSDLGLGVAQVRTIIQVVSMVAAACATAAAILGVGILQSKREARLGLTIVAVPLFVTGLVTSPLLCSAVATAAVMLWAQPARAWFEGRTAPVARPPSQSAIGPPADQPAPLPVPYPSPAGRPAEPPPPPTSYDAAPRPDALVWACSLVWAFAALTVLVLLVSVVALVASPTQLLDEVHRQNPDLAGQTITDHALVVTTCVLAGVFALWSVGASLAAALAMRGSRSAWKVLLVSTVGVGVVCGIATLASVVLLVPLAGAAATVRLLTRPSVRGWLRPGLPHV